MQNVWNGIDFACRNVAYKRDKNLAVAKNNEI